MRTAPTYPNGLPYRPEIAIQLIADDARSIRPCDLERLFDEEPRQYHEALLAFILASDASDRAKDEARRIVAERQTPEQRAENIMRGILTNQHQSPIAARRKPSPAQTIMLRMMRAGDDFHVTGFWARNERLILARAIQLGWVAETEPGSEWYRITPAGLSALEMIP